jgi:hypothetical protein
VLTCERRSREVLRSRARSHSHGVCIDFRQYILDCLPETGWKPCVSNPFPYRGASFADDVRVRRVEFVYRFDCAPRFGVGDEGSICRRRHAKSRWNGDVCADETCEIRSLPSGYGRVRCDIVFERDDKFRAV